MDTRQAAKYVRNLWVAFTPIIVFAITACSPPTTNEARFQQNKWLFPTIRDADQIVIYEGLPDKFERDIFETERRAKSTVDLHGFPFYELSIEVNKVDRSGLVLLLGDEASYAPLPTLAKACGEFHPDYCIQWSVGDQVYRCLVCFGCGEVKAFGTGKALHCDLAARDQFKRLLRQYWKSRPASEFWPSSLAVPEVPIEPKVASP